MGGPWTVHGADWAIVTKHADWYPQPLEVMQARSLARVFFVAKLGGAKPGDRESNEIQRILSHWKDFKLQAIGLTKNGHFVIHLNFLRNYDYSWDRNELIEVDDGGWNFWTINIDLGRFEAADLEINGYV